MTPETPLGLNLSPPSERDNRDILKDFLNNLPRIVVEGQDIRLKASMSLSSMGEFEIRGECIAGENTRPGPRLNEDTIFTLQTEKGSKCLIAAIDGASSQKGITGLEHYGISGAYLISHLLSYGLSQCAEWKRKSREKDFTAADIIIAANSFAGRYIPRIKGVDYNDVLTIPGAAAVFALIDPERGIVSIANVADCVGIVKFKDGKIKVVTPNRNQRFDEETEVVCARFCKEYGHSTREELRQNREAEAKIRQHLCDSFQRKINRPDGCGILNGQPQLTEHGLIDQTELPLNLIDSLYLCSDGALAPYLTANAKHDFENAARLMIAEREKTKDYFGIGFLKLGRKRLLETRNSGCVSKKVDDAGLVAAFINPSVV